METTPLPPPGDGGPSSDKDEPLEEEYLSSVESLYSAPESTDDSSYGIAPAAIVFHFDEGFKSEWPIELELMRHVCECERALGGLSREHLSGDLVYWSWKRWIIASGDIATFDNKGLSLAVELSRNMLYLKLQEVKITLHPSRIEQTAGDESLRRACRSFNASLISGLRRGKYPRRKGRLLER
jgi:hypothetical protein